MSYVYGRHFLLYREWNFWKLMTLIVSTTNVFNSKLCLRYKIYIRKRLYGNCPILTPSEVKTLYGLQQENLPRIYHEDHIVGNLYHISLLTYYISNYVCFNAKNCYGQSTRFSHWVVFPLDDEIKLAYTVKSRSSTCWSPQRVVPA